MYVDYDKIPHQARVQSYLKAMEALAGRYPADDEAQIFYAIALNVAASASDKTYANQLKGAAILGPIMERQPQHPGVAHYLIHLYDYPPIAAKGLPPALRYSKIAPNAPHAQHMPSHIFTRVGYWKDSIAANKASVQAAKASKEARRSDARAGLSRLRLSAARSGQGCARRRNRNRGDCGPILIAFRAAFAQAAAPARYMVERGDWNGAANLRSSQVNSRMQWRSPILPGRSAPPVPAMSMPPRSTPPSSLNCATSFETQERLLGWVRSMSRSRSRPPGCFMPSGKHDEALKVDERRGGRRGQHRKVAGHPRSAGACT